MKRRKKLWIASAALAVVVALCALALLYRQVPYRFLEGTTFVSVRPFTGVLQSYWSSPLRSASDYTIYEYRTERSADDVFDTAYRELKGRAEWQYLITIGGGSYECWNDRSNEMISIDYINNDIEGRKPFVRIKEIHPTTTIDRVLNWLHNR